MVINNKTEYEDFYPYDKKYIKRYPKEYPCIAIQKEKNCGIMGYETHVYVAYFPNSLDAKDNFLKGLFYDWIPLVYKNYDQRTLERT
jgi:hypothetical protein